MEQAFAEGKEINVRLVYPDATYQGGWGNLTDFSLDTPHDGEATVKGTVEGNGALSDRIIGAITPLTATFSLAAPVDKAFTITPNTTLLNSIKVDDAALTVTTDYAYSTGALTIEKEYLSELDAGVYVFVIVVKNGNDVSVVITVTA